MQTQIDTKNLQITPDLQHIINKKIHKLTRLCQLFKPDVVLLHLTLSQSQPPKGYSIHINLSVPHHQLTAITNDKKFGLALSQAVDKVSAQLRKYRAKLKKGDLFAQVSKDRGKV